MRSVGVDAAGVVVPGTDYVVRSPNVSAALFANDEFVQRNLAGGAMIWPVARIGSYAETGRTWTKLRFEAMLQASVASSVGLQNATVKLWPA
jgi:uncharacterized protein YhjY with autotransporter beta-barrel domain